MREPLPPVCLETTTILRCAPALVTVTAMSAWAQGEASWDPGAPWTRVEDIHPGWWLGVSKEVIFIDQVSQADLPNGDNCYVIHWRFEVDPHRSWYFECGGGLSLMLVDDTDEVPI